MNKPIDDKIGMLCVISSPSGGGKTSVIKTVLKLNPEYKYSISATTRIKRKNEIHGVDYYFLTEEKFDLYIEQEEFIEWAEVHSKRYGTLKKPIETMLAAGNVVLLDLDVIGGMNVKKYFRDRSLLIFLTPYSIEELRRRLLGRKTEKIEQIKKRLERLPMEMSYVDKYDVRIVNNKFNTTVNQVDKVIKKQKTELEA